jgi:hypothetical protein
MKEDTFLKADLNECMRKNIFLKLFLILSLLKTKFGINRQYSFYTYSPLNRGITPVGRKKGGLNHTAIRVENLIEQKNYSLPLKPKQGVMGGSAPYLNQSSSKKMTNNVKNMPSNMLKTHTN